MNRGVLGMAILGLGGEFFCLVVWGWARDCRM
jgi:hypothetical protein